MLAEVGDTVPLMETTILAFPDRSLRQPCPRTAGPNSPGREATKSTRLKFLSARQRDPSGTGNVIELPTALSGTANSLCRRLPTSGQGDPRADHHGRGCHHDRKARTMTSCHDGTARAVSPQRLANFEDEDVDLELAPSAAPPREGEPSSDLAPEPRTARKGPQKGASSAWRRPWRLRPTSWKPSRPRRRQGPRRRP